MKLQFFCPRWGCEAMPWNDFFAQVRSAGYDGVEMGFPPTLSATEKREIVEGLQSQDLAVIGQHWHTVDKDFDTHQSTYKQHLQSLAELNPLFINSQTGKDYYTVEQNLSLMQTAHEISRETSIDILHETHRGKWSFAAHITKQYLKLTPQIRLTLDLSHWCNVAESLLEDQEEAVGLAIQHTDHLHARVGFAEGPQVIDPRVPENAEILAAHLRWWDALVERKASEGAATFTITPEYGAPPYQALLPYTQQPIADQWDINLWMKDLLKARYAHYTD